jgi:hypothetical protein
MVSAKQLKTLGLSWFRPGLYVQQGCARGTVLLHTGVPVVGRLQARWERRRGLQVLGGVIEASANIVGRREACERSQPVTPCLMSPPPAARGISFLLYTKERVIYRRVALFIYVWRYGVQGRGVGGRPGEPCPGHGVMACLVLEQGAASRVKAQWLTEASPRGLEEAIDGDPYGVQWQAWWSPIPACSTAPELL